MRRKWPTRAARQRGVNLLETSLMIVVIFTVVFWIFEVCWVMYTYTVMADAANEGVRYAIVHSGSNTATLRADTISRVRAFAATSMHDTSAMVVTVSFPDTTATPPNRVQVTVNYTFIPYLPQFMTGPSMRTYAEGRMVVQ